MKIITEDSDLAPDKMANLIFSSGLSTKSTISEISGRGVGMDAVKKQLEQTSCHIEIELGDQKEVGIYDFRFRINIQKDLWRRVLHK